MIQITEENFRKAYDEGCSDVKKVLKTLVPDFKFAKAYPKLKIGLSTGTIILFTERCTGIVVYSRDKLWPVGYKSDTWTEQNFVDYEFPEER